MVLNLDDGNLVKNKLNIFYGILLVLLYQIIEIILIHLSGTLYTSILFNPFIRGISFGITLLLAVKTLKINLRELFKRSYFSKRFFKSSIILFVGTYFLFAILEEMITYQKLGINDYLILFNSARGLDRNFITLIIVSPIFEEILFRGIIYNGFQIKYGTNIAYAFSAFLFSIAHLDFDSTFIVYDLLTFFLLGILFAWAFHKSSSLLMVIGLHVSWNVFDYIFGYSIIVFDLNLVTKADFIFFILSLIIICMVLLLIFYNRIINEKY